MNGRLAARRIVRNIGWNLAAQVWLLVLVVATTPYLVARLGVESYGLYALVGALVGWFAVFDLGLNVATVKYVAEERGRGDLDAARRIVGTALALYLVIGLVGTSVLAISAPFVAGEILRLEASQTEVGVAALRLTALGFLVALALAASTAVPTACQRLDLVNRRLLVFGSLSLLAPVGVLAAGYGVLAAIAAGLAANAVAVVSFTRLSRRLLPGVPLRPALDRPTARRLLGFGALKLVGHASTQAVYHLDKVIVGALLGLGAVAFYAIPVLVAQRLVSLVANVATAFFPAASDLHGRADAPRLHELYVRSSKLVALLVFPSATLLGVFAEPLLRLWVGEDFAREGAWPLRLLVAGYALNALTTMPSLVADSVGRPRITATFSVASGVLNVALSLVLIPPFGLVGAACAIVITSLTLLPPLLFYVHRRVLAVGLWDTIRRSLMRPALATVLVAALAAALVPLADSLLRLAGCVAAAGGAYVLVTVLVGVYDETDRDVLRASLARVSPGTS